MFGLFKKKSEDINLDVASMGSFLVDDKEADLENPLKEHLSSEKLDYSPESLKYVDSYLDAVRNDRSSLSEAQLVKVILRCGAYCGEVIRKNSSKKFTWVTYEYATSKSPEIKTFSPQKDIFSSFILLEEPDSFSFPFPKVWKYIENGPEDSLYFFASTVGSFQK